MKLESIIPLKRRGDQNCSGGTAAWVMAAVIVFCLGLFGLLAAGAAESSSTNDYSGVDAIFTKHCLECHEAKDPEANLVLENFETLMKGSENGAVIQGSISANGRVFLLSPAGVLFTETSSVNVNALFASTLDM